MISIIKKIFKKILSAILVATIWLVIWQIIYICVDAPLFVASPLSVFLRFVELACTWLFWKTVLYSVLRILFGFILGIVFGTFMAFVCTVDFAEKLFEPIKVIIRATPVASFIMLTWIWLERAYIPVFISFLMVVPVMWGNVATGIKNVSKEYKELAKVYKFSLVKRIKYIYIPSVLPYFATAVCTSSGLVWKAGIAAEVLCQPPGTIGASLFSAKSILETVDIFTWTVVVILISIALEKIIKTVLRRLEKKFKFAGLT